jgi:hypothetical protein
MRKAFGVKFFVAWFLVSICSPNLEIKAQPLDLNKALDQRLNSFVFKNGSLSLALQRLATEHHLLIGFESLPATEKQLDINVEVEDGRVRDALDAIIAKDTRYEWTVSDDAIEIRPRAQRDRLMGVEFDRFRVDQVNRNEAVDAFVNSREVQAVLKNAGVRRREIMSLPGDASDNLLRFSLDLHQATARKILNEIAIESGSVFWVFSRYGQHNEYVSIKMK